MKRNIKNLTLVSSLAALLVLSNISIANAASCDTVSGGKITSKWTSAKVYTFSFSNYLNKNSIVIKVPTKGDVVNTDKLIGTIIPKTGTPKAEAPKQEAPKQEAPKQETPKQEAPKQESPILDSVNATEKEVVRLVNVERQKNGLSPLVLDADLSKVARAKSQDMSTNRYFSHTSPTYGSPFEMMKKFGIKYSSAGENIAMGQPTAEAVVKAWMNSDGHRANILSKNFTKIGVGYFKGSNGSPYWTQMFIRP